MLLFGKKAKQASLCAAVVGDMADAVIAVDDKKTVAVLNKAAANMFGCAPEEIIGLPLHKILPEFQPPHVGGVVQIQGIKKGGAAFVALAHVVRSGQGFALVLRRPVTTAESEEELLRLAATDALTGVLNRREFVLVAAKEAERANRYARPLSVLMLDIDNFKKVNGAYGHEVGDLVLQKFASMCRGTLRGVDIFARWGGEEFAALLPETPIEGAGVIAERLRKMTADTPIDTGKHHIKLTVSVGVSQFRPGEVTIDAPIGRAESASVEAKKAGQNRVSVSRN